MPEPDHQFLGPDRGPSEGPRGLRALVVPLVSAAIALAVSVPVLRLQDARWRIPFWYADRSDAFFYSMIVKTIADDGSVLRTPQLGAPHGLNLADFPLGADNLNYLIIRVLSFASDDWGLLVNVFFVLTFPLAAATGAAVIRSLRVRPALAIAGGVLFAFIPFHLYRGQGHLFLSAYYGVPIGCWLALVPLRRAAGLGIAGLATGGRPSARVIALLIGAVVVAGSTGVYFAAFALTSLGVVVLVLLAAGRDQWRHAALAAALAAGVAAVVLVNFAPSIAYRWEHGENPAVDSRQVAHAEELGLRLTDLVLPVADHRWSVLREIRERYEEAPNAGGPEATAIGLLPTVGLVVLLLALAAAAVRRATDLSDPLLLLGVLALGALLFGISGGLGTLLAVLTSPWLRGWNRISVLLAFVGLAAVTLVADRLLNRVAGRVGGALAVATAGLLVLVGVVDQVPRTATRPDHDLAEKAWNIDRGVVVAAMDELSPRPKVLQLPYVPFPEWPPVVFMRDYDHLRGYLHADDARWTYGAIKGRPEDWAAAFGPQPTKVALTAGLLIDVDSLWVDGAGYPDGGAFIENELTQLIGSPDVGGIIRVWDLRGRRDRLREELASGERERLRSLVLDPVAVGFGDGVGRLEADGARSWRWARQRSEITLRNASSRRRRVVVSMNLASAAGGDHRTQIRYGDGRTRAVGVTTEPTAVQETIDLEPGVTTLTLTTDAPEVLNAGNLVSVRISAVSVVDVGVLEASDVLAGLGQP